MDKKLKVLLLAAGLGTRLKPLTNKIPKCLVRINEKPLLHLWLEKLENLNCDLDKWFVYNCTTGDNPTLRKFSH